MTEQPGGSAGTTTPRVVRHARSSDLSPTLDAERLAVGRFPSGWRPPALPPGFCALVHDATEVTLVCPESAYDAGLLGSVPPLGLDRGWLRITFPGPLPWELVGFLADVAERLASAQIPFTSVSGFTTDHVLVRAAAAELAVAVLSGQDPPPPRPGTTNP